MTPLFIVIERASATTCQLVTKSLARQNAQAEITSSGFQMPFVMTHVMIKCNNTKTTNFKIINNF